MNIWQKINTLSNHINEFFTINKFKYNDDVKLAVTVIFVDLANIDNHFSDEEHSYIKNKLRDYFSISLDEVYKLIEEATLAVKYNIGQDTLAESLKLNMPAMERERMVIFMDELICSDQEKNSFEVTLMSHYTKLLGVRV